MTKITPDPPDTDPTSPHETTDPILDEASERIPSAADIRATPRTPCKMFIVNPDYDVETLLGHACESLASANVMVMDLADRTEGTSRNTLLGIAQVINSGELVVNRALDQLDPVG
jgi:hypothetical protein